MSHAPSIEREEFTRDARKVRPADSTRASRRGRLSLQRILAIAVVLALHGFVLLRLSLPSLPLSRMRLVTATATQVTWLTLYDAPHPPPRIAPAIRLPRQRAVHSTERSKSPSVQRSAPHPPIQVAQQQLDLRRTPAHPAFRDAAMPSLQRLQNPFQKANVNTLLPGSSKPILDNKHLRLIPMASIQDVVHQIECAVACLAINSGTMGTSQQQLLARGLTPRTMHQMNKVYHCN